VTKLRALIVDDEPLARERLRALLPAGDVEVVGECGSGTEAIAALKQPGIDLVFLDVQMPGCDGLAVLDKVPAAQRPAVVFVTAYEKYALEAFNVQAVYYLLKPFDRDRLEQSLQRVQEHLRARRAGKLEEKLASLLADAPAAAKKPDRLAVKADGKVIFLKPDDIAWVEAADNYVVIHHSGGQLMLRETMAAIEEKLGTERFARINRSALVHLDQIKELQPTFHGDYIVFLKDGTKLPLSRSLRGQLDKLTGERLG
jgi:two-component system LytT family response regulator